MNHRETSDFLDHIKEHTEQEIITNMSDIKEYFRWIPWSFKRSISAAHSIRPKPKCVYFS